MGRAGDRGSMRRLRGIDDSREIELEIEFARDSEGGRTRYHVHPLCFAIFNRELERLSGRADNGGTQLVAESVDDKVVGLDEDS